MIWGFAIVFNSLFKMKEADYKENSRFGASGFLFMELLFAVMKRLPWQLVKGLVILIGIALIGTGAAIL